MKKLYPVIAILALFLLSSCSGDYIYYKSKCACEPLINYADIRNV